MRRRTPILSLVLAGLLLPAIPSAGQENDSPFEEAVFLTLGGVAGNCMIQFCNLEGSPVEAFLFIPKYPRRHPDPRFIWCDDLVGLCDEDESILADDRWFSAPLTAECPIMTIGASEDGCARSALGGAIRFANGVIIGDPASVTMLRRFRTFAEEDIGKAIDILQRSRTKREALRAFRKELRLQKARSADPRTRMFFRAVFEMCVGGLKEVGDQEAFDSWREEAISKMRNHAAALKGEAMPEPVQ